MADDGSTQTTAAWPLAKFHFQLQSLAGCMRMIRATRKQGQERHMAKGIQMLAIPSGNPCTMGPRMQLRFPPLS